MNANHYTKDISAANAIASATTATLLYGPIPIDHLDNFALHFVNCGSEALYLSLKTSFDEGRTFEDSFPLGSFSNSEAIGVRPNETLVRSLYSVNPFRYITILGSANATIGVSQMCLKISGRSRS